MLLTQEGQDQDQRDEDSAEIVAYNDSVCKVVRKEGSQSVYTVLVDPVGTIKNNNRGHRQDEKASHPSKTDMLVKQFRVDTYMRRCRCK